MNKRGISNVILVIILILLAIVLILIIWGIISIRIKEQGEITQATQQLLIERFEIKNISGSFPNPGESTAIVGRGPTKIIFVNISFIERKSDIVFLVDSTASMGSLIGNASEVVIQFVNKLKQQNIDARLALIEFRDYNGSQPCGYNNFPNKTHVFSDEVFTTDTTEYANRMIAISNSVGGSSDGPESHLTAINSSFLLPFDENAKKILILISDAKPHARDCFTDGADLSFSFSDYYINGENLTTYPLNDTNPDMPACYKGPEYVSSITNELRNRNVVFYEINSDRPWRRPDGSVAPAGVCDNRIDLEMSSATGGRFYNFEQASDIQGIIDDLANQLVENYRGEQIISYLYLVFYNANETQTIKIDKPPILPYETKKYEFETSLTNVIKAELYPVIVTPSGKEVIGPLVDTWKF